MDKINKELFIQDLNSKYTLLQEVNYLVKNILKIIDIVNTSNIDDYDELKTYINTIKNYIVQNENTTEIGGNLEVDGFIKTNTGLRLSKVSEGSYDFNGKTFYLDTPLTQKFNLIEISDNTTDNKYYGLLLGNSCVVGIRNEYFFNDDVLVQLTVDTNSSQEIYCEIIHDRVPEEVGGNNNINFSSCVIYNLPLLLN